MISVGDGIVGSPDKQKVRSQHHVQVIPCWPVSIESISVVLTIVKIA